ncbi:hypothetical protein ACFQU2_32390 [Siccirubricoccus deserti]
MDPAAGDLGHALGPERRFEGHVLADAGQAAEDLDPDRTAFGRRHRRCGAADGDCQAAQQCPAHPADSGEAGRPKTPFQAGLFACHHHNAKPTLGALNF